MIKNERGFVFPIALIVSSMMIIALLYQTEAFLTEKRFLLEREELELLESLKQVGLIDITNITRGMEDNGSRIQGNLLYKFGSITYSISPYEEDIVKINLTCYTNNNRSTRVLILYNTIDEAIEHWVEG